MNDQVFTYSSVNKSEELNLTAVIKYEDCSENNSEMKNNFSASVQIKNNVYEGRAVPGLFENW